MKTLTINMKAGGDVAEVLLYDDIGEGFFGGGISAKTFRDQIKAIKAKTINLRVNSGGGSVFEAAAMKAALDEFKGQVEVDIDGLAASAASVVAMAGDKIRMASNAMMMIHNPMSGVMGGAEEMRREADLLDKVKGQILDTYGIKAKVDRATLAAWMDAETWFTGPEAVNAGLADEVTPASTVANFAGLEKFKYRNVPKPVGPTPEELAAHAARVAFVSKLK